MDNVDFDMAAYHRLLDQHKIGRERKDLHIFLSDPYSMPEAFGARQQVDGAYIGDLQSALSEKGRKGIAQQKGILLAYDKVPDIRPIPLGPLNSPNSVLLHETKHFSQDVRGKLMSERKIARRQKISRILPVFGPMLEYLIRPEEISARILTTRNRSKHKSFVQTVPRWPE